MSSSINKNVNVERRTWDKEAYESRARSRANADTDANGTASATTDAGDAATTSENKNSALKNEINPTQEKEEFLPAQHGRAGPEGSERAFLKSRSKKVDLEGKLGSTEIIDPAAASATKSGLLDDATADSALTHASGVSKCTDGVGWHCRVCDCFLKDSLTYLDHINGRKHQRHLGYTMRVEKSTTAQVSGVLSGLADKKREKEGVGSGILGGGGAANTPEAVDFEDAVRKKDEEALRRKAERARKRDERKRKGREGASNYTLVQMNVEGEKKITEGENPVDEEEEEEDNGGIDPDMAAMMGFSGFGGSLK